MSTKNVSPLRYPGGKTRACKVLDEVIAQYFNVRAFDTVVSPFFGGGSFEFHLQNKYGYALRVNDKFTPLYHFWQQVKTNQTALCEELRRHPVVTKDDFMRYRHGIMALDHDPLQQAAQYFMINRCSFSGATLSGGFSEEASKNRYTASSVDRIAALDFRNIDLYHEDFQPFIRSHVSNTSLLFLDPPYYLEKKSKLYGNHGDMHEDFDHRRLFEVLRTQKNWLLTYNNCDFIRTLYQDYQILEVHWSYGMNTSKASSEIVILGTSV